MHINDKSKRQFLYKPSYFAGMIVDDEPLTFDSFYAISDEFISLKQTFYRSTLCELICELIHIFKMGSPNYSRLATLFGDSYDYTHGGLIAVYGLKEAKARKEEFETQHGLGKAGMDYGNKIIVSVEPVDRMFEDIIKIEMDIDIETLKVDFLYLYVNGSLDLIKVKNDLEQYYHNIVILKEESLTISNESCQIIITNSNLN
ncbi:hypothetical protein [Paenibacillus xylanexedens]|uniref:hypothetical protein n=1 Tax=Paenibacillus xylanexedens TaxID=528191 RepID=UPI0011A822AA|nr:hypothetical protein [Paenibacillus xylanexedens]